MPNPRLATRYAKSLVDLAVEKGQLEAVNNDVEFMRELIKVSPEVRMILVSPVIKPDKKVLILSAVTKGKVGPITTGFFALLLKKSRENILPEIVAAFKDQYNTIKGIHKVKFTTSHPIDDIQRQMVIDRLIRETGMKHVELETKVDESLIGGFVLEYENNLIDASIKHDLHNIRKSFMRNDYIYNIR
jgi:F-type H+-transporting ATPase subunit delta